MNLTLSRFDVLDNLAECASFFVSDVDSGEILWVSRPLEIMFGYMTRNDLLKKNVADLVPESERGKHAREVALTAKVSTSTPGVSLCAKGLHADGHTFDIAVGLSGAVISGRRTVIATVLQLHTKGAA